jgi:hypothetical protein
MQKRFFSILINIKKPTKVSRILTKDKRAEFLNESKKILTHVQGLDIPKYAQSSYENPVHKCRQKLSDVITNVMTLSNTLENNRGHYNDSRENIVKDKTMMTLRLDVEDLNKKMKDFKVTCGYDVNSCKNFEDISDIIDQNMKTDLYGSVFKDINFRHISKLQSELYFVSNAQIIRPIKFFRDYFEIEILGRRARSPEETFSILCGRHFKYVDFNRYEHNHPYIRETYNFCDTIKMDYVPMFPDIGMNTLDPFIDSLEKMINIVDNFISALSLELKSYEKFINVCKKIHNSRRINNDAIDLAREFSNATIIFDNEIRLMKEELTSDNYSWTYTIFLHNINCLKFKASRQIMGIIQE